MKKSAHLKTMFQKYGNEITVYPKYKKEYQVKGFIRPLSFQHLVRLNIALTENWRKPNWNRMTSYIGLQNPGQSICKMSQSMFVRYCRKL